MSKIHDSEQVSQAIRVAVCDVVDCFGIEFVRTLSMFPSASSHDVLDIAA